MSDRVQQHLRDALADRADVFPYAAAADRLSHVDYKPRYSRRLSAHLLGVLSVSATAALTAVVAVLLTVGGSPPAAFAGWSPTPKVLTAKQFRAVARVIREHWSPRCSGPGGSIVLADVRGPHTFSLYVTNPASRERLATVCLNGVENGSGGDPAAHSWPPTVAPGRTRFFLTEYGTINQHQGVISPFIFTEVGRAGADVRSITMLLSTGTKVQATIGHGWYLVWWPARYGYSKKLIITTSSSNATVEKTYEVADNNGRISAACGAGPATNAISIRIQTENLKLERKQLIPSQRRIALETWLRQHGYAPARGKRPC